MRVRQPKGSFFLAGVFPERGQGRSFAQGMGQSAGCCVGDQSSG